MASETLDNDSMFADISTQRVNPAKVSEFVNREGAASPANLPRVERVLRALRAVLRPSWDAQTSSPEDVVKSIKEQQLVETAKHELEDLHDQMIYGKDKWVDARYSGQSGR